MFDNYCEEHYNNGECDMGCDSAECNWDGLDCDTDPPQIANGSLSIVVLMDMQEFKSNSVRFLRNVGRDLRTVVRIKLDAFGDWMVYPWPDDDKLSTAFGGNTLIYSPRPQGVIVNLEIDNRKCKKTEGYECFNNAEEVRYLIFKPNFDFKSVCNFVILNETSFTSSKI